MGIKNMIVKGFSLLKPIPLKDKIINYASLEVAVKGIFVEIKKKEPKITRTDVPENNNQKVFSALGALNLKNWLVTNYTTLMNNIRDNLTTLINGKLSHGGYGGTGQTLFNLIESAKTNLTSLINSNKSKLENLDRDKQDKNDQSLKTNSKNIVGAINENKNTFSNVFIGQNERCIVDIDTNPLIGDTKSGIYRVDGLSVGLKNDGYAMIRMAHPTLEKYGCSFYCRYNFKDEIYVSAFVDGKNAIQLASREWLGSKLQNYIGLIERSGTYTLSTAISQSYAFIYVRFGDSDGNWTQIIKIPTNNKDLQCVVFGSTESTSGTEAGRILFISNTQLKYIVENISARSQVTIKEIWQSNV